MLYIEVSGELEQRLIQIAQAHDRSTEEWVTQLLAGLTEHLELLEDLEDIMESDRIKKAMTTDEETLITWEKLKQELEL